MDLETGAVLAVTLQPATAGDTNTLHETLTQCGEHIREVAAESETEATAQLNPEGPAELVLDKGYHSNDALLLLKEVEVRSYCSEPDRGRDIDTSKTNERFVGLPKGYDSVRVTIHGRTATHTNSDPLHGQGWVADDVRAMLRNLLVERFQIKWHYEDRMLDAYSLVSSGKSKLKTADPANRATCHEARSIRNDPRGSNPLLAELISCRNVTIAHFAAKLYQIYDDFAFPLEDATGISGTWDFDLSLHPVG